MVNLPTQIIKVSRPIHWVKNLSLFAALIFSRQLFVSIPFVRVFWAFVAFSLASSAAYIFNDVLDAKLDKLHPIKRNRPIASGKLSIPIALFIAFSYALISLYLSACLNSIFFFLVLTYIVLQIAYSLGLKNITVIDILIIAAGFIIRVYAGAFVIDTHLSVWFLLCVISVALFLASGKRRAELNLIKETSEITRKSLTMYKTELLNSYVTMFGNAAWMSWALYSFFESPKATVPVWLFLAELSRTTTVSKMLMITIPVVIFGIMRYQSLIFEDRTEAPEKLLLTDRPLVVAVLLYGTLIIWILYGGVSVIG